jgi:hypothetical protein
VQGGAGDWRTSGADIPTRTAARVRKGTQRIGQRVPRRNGRW